MTVSRARAAAIVASLGAGLAAAVPASAEVPDLVVPKPGETVTTGGVRVRVLPRQEIPEERCCVLEFQRWQEREGTGEWVAAPASLGPEVTAPGTADAAGSNFRREAFASATRWRVRARFTDDKDWTAWREFTVPRAAGGR